MPAMTLKWLSMCRLSENRCRVAESVALDFQNVRTVFHVADTDAETRLPRCKRLRLDQATVHAVDSRGIALRKCGPGLDL